MSKKIKWYNLTQLGHYVAYAVLEAVRGNMFWYGPEYRSQQFNWALEFNKDEYEKLRQMNDSLGIEVESTTASLFLTEYEESLLSWLIDNVLDNQRDCLVTGGFKGDYGKWSMHLTRGEYRTLPVIMKKLAKIDFVEGGVPDEPVPAEKVSWVVVDRMLVDVFPGWKELMKNVISEDSAIRLGLCNEDGTPKKSTYEVEFNKVNQQFKEHLRKLVKPPEHFIVDNGPLKKLGIDLKGMELF